jgi:hypothetical protein
MNQDRAARVLAASKCTHHECGGVFARNPWAPDRTDRCESCGRGKHWEHRRERQELLPGEVPEYAVPKPNLLSWGESLGARYNRWGDRVDKSYGRRKTYYFTSKGKLDGVPQGGRSRDGKEAGSWASNAYDVGKDILSDGGWIIRHEGTTGTPEGRPKTGVTDPEKIVEALNTLLHASDLWLARLISELWGSDTLPWKSDAIGVNGRKGHGRKTALSLLIACLTRGDRPVNTQALAEFWSRDNSTLRSYARSGHNWIYDNGLLLALTVPEGMVAPLPRNPPAKSPKGGEMNATAERAIIERLDRIEASTTRIELRQQMQGERDDYEREQITGVESLDDA